MQSKKGDILAFLDAKFSKLDKKKRKKKAKAKEEKKKSENMGYKAEVNAYERNQNEL